MWQIDGGKTSQASRNHDMARRQLAVAHKHVAALSALKVYSGHMPMDGLCLEELQHMGLVRPVRDGYALTPRGLETLSEEVADAKSRYAAQYQLRA